MGKFLCYIYFYVSIMSGIEDEFSAKFWGKSSLYLWIFYVTTINFTASKILVTKTIISKSIEAIREINGTPKIDSYPLFLTQFFLPFFSIFIILSFAFIIDILFSRSLELLYPLLPLYSRFSSHRLTFSKRPKGPPSFFSCWLLLFNLG